MEMGKIKYYMNQYDYPHYSQTLTEYYEEERDCTPVGMGLKTGKLHVAGSMTDFMHVNYFRFQRGGETFYAWIDDVNFRTDNSYDITYSVDAWRTYRNQIELGVQYIGRAPNPPGTSAFIRKPDRLLGGGDPYNLTEVIKHDIEDSSKRVFVVQMRVDTGETYSRSPVQPTPYDFYFTEYDVNNWQGAYHIEQVMEAISGEKPENLVTMYSIPFMKLDLLDAAQLALHQPDGDTVYIDGFKRLGDNDPKFLLTNLTRINLPADFKEMFDGPHSVSVVVPEAGIISIPDELLVKENIFLRQDVDMFSGASNYMLQVNGFNYTQSIRGSSVASIPIISDPLDTYLSQNQNALTTSLIGDVAMIAGGGLMAAGLPGLGAAMGGGAAMTGISNIVKREATQADMGSNFSNPPAFLGTALASNFNQTFWVVVTKAGIDNRQLVWDNYGHVYDMVDNLTFPVSGFIQTEGCNVRSKPGWGVPRWALQSINSMFDNGVQVHL